MLAGAIASLARRAEEATCETRALQDFARATLTTQKVEAGKYSL